jgi:hypothetical protein
LESGAQTQQLNVITVKDFMLQPNPTRNFAYVSFTADRQYAYSLQLFDVTGKLLLGKTAVAKTGINNMPIDVTQFASGSYFVLFRNDKGETKTIRLVKYN